MHCKYIRNELDGLISDGQAKKLSRPDFIHHSLLAGLSLSSASALWTQSVAAQAPQNGGKLKISLHDGNTADTHDPGTDQSVGMIQLAHAHRRYLTETTSENGLGLDMATGRSVPCLKRITALTGTVEQIGRDNIRQRPYVNRCFCL